VVRGRYQQKTPVFVKEKLELLEPRRVVIAELIHLGQEIPSKGSNVRGVRQPEHEFAA